MSDQKIFQMRNVDIIQQKIFSIISLKTKVLQDMTFGYYPTKDN